MSLPADLSILPGGDLIEAGLRDLAGGRRTEAALLVLIGAPRLKRLGLALPPDESGGPEHELYRLLQEADPDAAHSRYNALLRRLVSFERSGMRRLADAELIRRFMRALHEEADVPARVFLTGGATAVLLGWRPTTIDIDVRWEPDRDELFRALPGIKERLQVNVEWPFDFIPQPPGWRDRSRFIASEGRLQFFHCDLYAQTLAKIERGHAQDRRDVRTMLEKRLVEPERLRAHFEAIVPQLYRYPAVDPEAFRRAVKEFSGASPDPE